MKNMFNQLKRVCVTTIVAAICICSLVGCASQSSKDENSSKKEDDKVTIGFSFDSYIIERWQRDRDVFVSTAKDLGAEVNVQSANGIVSEQIAQIEYFIDKKMDVIVIVAIDSDSLSDVVKKARDAGIKVIAYDRLIKNADTDMYISFDNEAVGEKMGEAIASNPATSKVVMICGAPADNNVSMVNGAFEEVMAEHNIGVIGKTFCEGWKADLAVDFVNENISLINQADAIMCGNDDIATNVIRTLAVNRKAGKIDVVGQDADLAACQHVVEGTQIMTVYKPVERLASEAAKYAVMLAKGEDTGVSTSLNDGTYDVPYVALEPISVNKDNIDEVIIDGGFHLREDVYLNVSK